MYWNEGWYRIDNSKIEIILLRQIENIFFIVDCKNKTLFKHHSYEKVLYYLLDRKFKFVNGKIYPNKDYFIYNSLFFEWFEIWIEEDDYPIIHILGKRYNEKKYYIIYIKENEITFIYDSYEEAYDLLSEDESRLLDSRLEEALTRTIGSHQFIINEKK